MHLDPFLTGSRKINKRKSALGQDVRRPYQLSTRLGHDPINPNPTAPTIQQMNEFISNLPAELPGAPLGSFLQQPFNTNQQPTFLNQQAFISSNPQVSFFLNIFLVMAGWVFLAFRKSTIVVLIF